jgi:hypothetical protein
MYVLRTSIEYHVRFLLEGWEKSESFGAEALLVRLTLKTPLAPLRSLTR